MKNTNSNGPAIVRGRVANAVTERSGASLPLPPIHHLPHLVVRHGQHQNMISATVAAITGPKQERLHIHLAGPPRAITLNSGIDKKTWSAAAAQQHSRRNSLPAGAVDFGRLQQISAYSPATHR